mgnify:CR=1 FL=1
MYGYDANSRRRLRACPAHAARAAEAQRPVVRRCKRRLAARDWQEIITFSFVSSATEALLARRRAPDATPIRVLNPIAAHLDVMRTTLLPGSLDTLRTNLSHKAPRVRVFETGRVFRRAECAGYAQPLRIGGLAYGDALPEQWGERARRVDFFDVKGDLAALAGAAFGVTTVAAPLTVACIPDASRSVADRRRPVRLSGRAAPAARRATTSCRWRRSCSRSTLGRC